MSAPAAASDTGGAGEQLQAGIVLNLVVLAILADDAAVAVRGVFAQANVGDQDQVIEAVIGFEGANSPLHDAVLRPCAAALLVLFRRQAKEQQAANAEGGGLGCFFQRLVDR